MGYPGVRRGSAAALALATLAIVPGCASPPASPRTADGRLGPFLLEVVERWEVGDPDAALELARAHGLRSSDGATPRIVAVLDPADDLAAVDVDALAAAGARVDARSASRLRIDVPLDALRGVAELAGVAVVRIPARPREVGFGDVVSEAVSLTGAADFHELGLDGTGIAAAVIDSGFEGLSDAIDDGELPDTAVAVLGGTVVAWSDIENTSQHGTGVAEHLLDMAPGVTLHCVQVRDEVDLENATDYLAAEGIRVVNQSLAWGGQSYYDDSGPITSLVNRSHDDDGVFWAVSAGNYAAKHWRGNWADGGDQLLDYQGDHSTLELAEGPYAGVTVYLNWDQYETPVTNLDLFVYSGSWDLIATSEIEQSGLTGYWPVEAVSFDYDPDQAPYQVVVEHLWGDTADLDVSLFSFYNDVEYAVPEASLVEPADAHGAFTAGAVEREQWGDAVPAIEAFSSQGPTTDGRTKPDLTAPDRTSTFTYGEHAGWGTSFASPTVAGAAALLLSLDPALTADQLSATLRFFARDVGDAGHDPVFGAGLLTLSLEQSCVDVDGDGFGVGAFANAACAQTDLDCDDDRDDVHPGAADDWYDGVDADCDGASDFDADGDGHDRDLEGGGDCDDDDPAVHPGVPEQCEDGIDNDCDGDVDDQDGDCATGDDDDDDDSTAGDDDSAADDDDSTGPPADDDDGAPMDEGDDCSCRHGSTASPSPATFLLPLAALGLRRFRRGRLSSFI
jgi:hypothetical protein